MFQKYLSAYIWLGILSPLVSILLAIAVYLCSIEVFSFLKDLNFLANVSQFALPYLMGAIWLWYAKPVWEDPKFKFCNQLWRGSYALLLLFWVSKSCTFLFPDTTYSGGWTVYPSLNTNPVDSGENVFIQFAFDLLSNATLLLATFFQCINLLTLIFSQRRIIFSQKIKITTLLLTLISIYILFGSILSLLLIGLLCADKFLDTSFFLSDIYIAGQNSPQQLPYTSVWDIYYSFLHTPALLLTLWVFLSQKPRSTLGLIFIGLSVITALLFHYWGFGSESINIQLHDTSFVINGSGDTWEYFIYFGLIAILYQSILLNGQKLSIRLSYVQLFVSALGIAVMCLTHRGFWNFSRRYMSYSSVQMYTEELEMFAKLFLLSVILMAISQTILAFNYWLYNRQKAETPVQ